MAIPMLNNRKRTEHLSNVAWTQLPGTPDESNRRPAGAAVALASEVQRGRPVLDLLGSRDRAWQTRMSAPRCLPAPELLSVPAIEHRASVEPRTALRGHPVGGRRRSPKSRFVIEHLRLSGAPPCRENWVDDPPGRLDLVSPSEQARFPRHRIKQQSLIGLRHYAVEFALEAEIEVGHPKLHAGIRHLRLKVQLNPLGG